MTYKPTSDDFEDEQRSYKPTSQDFENNNEPINLKPQSLSSGLEGLVKNSFMDYLKQSVLQNPAIKKASSFDIGALQGTGDIGASVLNIPSNIIQSQTGEVPYHVPHPDLRKFYSDQSSGRTGEFFSPIPGVAGGKFLQSVEHIPGLLGRLSRIVVGAGVGASTGAATQEGNRLPSALLGLAFGAGSSAIPELYGAGKNLYQSAKEIPKLRNALEYKILNSAKNIESGKTNLEQSKSDAAQLISNQEEKHLSKVRESKQNIEQAFPNYSKKQVDEMIVSSVNKGIDKLNSSFNDRFKSWSNESGNKQVSIPMVTSGDDLKSIGVTTSSALKQQSKLKPKTVELSILDQHGDPYKLTIPGKSSTVDHYLDFYRTTRDLAGEAQRKAREAAIDSDRIKLQDQAKSLRKLSNDAFSTIQKNVSPSQFEKLQKLHNEYGQLKGGFYESPELTRAYYGKESHPSTTTNLTSKSKFEPIHNWLSENEPGYISALKAQRFSGEGHPLSIDDLNSQSKGIINLQKTEKDTANLLSNHEKELLQNRVNLSQEAEYINKIKSAIKQKGLNEKLEKVSRSQIKGYTPKVKQALERIEKSNNHQNQLEKEARLLGIDKLDIQRMINEKNTIIKKLLTQGIKHVGYGNLFDIGSSLL